jgi:hypothetical protein
MLYEGVKEFLVCRARLVNKHNVSTVQYCQNQINVTSTPMKRDHQALWSALAIGCLVLTTLTLAALGKLHSFRVKDPLRTPPLCRNGWLIQQQRNDLQGRCLLMQDNYATIGSSSFFSEAGKAR